jgi:hypothetical protein
MWAKGWAKIVFFHDAGKIWAIITKKYFLRKNTMGYCKMTIRLTEFIIIKSNINLCRRLASGTSLVLR